MLGLSSILMIDCGYLISIGVLLALGVEKMKAVALLRSGAEAGGYI